LGQGGYTSPLNIYSGGRILGTPSVTSDRAGYGIKLTTGTVNIVGGSVIGGTGDNAGGAGVYLYGGTLTNSGRIAGGSGISGGPDSGGAGVVERHGALNNQGTITAGTGNYGVFDIGGTLTNDGTITGGDGIGVNSGGVGVYLESGATLTTSGTISGGTGVRIGDAVKLASGTTLVVEPGAKFNGIVAAVGGGTTLELSGTQNGGTGITLGSFFERASHGTQFNSFKTLDFAPGAQWSVSAYTSATAQYANYDALIGMRVNGFAPGDSIDATNLTFNSSGDSFNATTDVLTLSNGNTVQFDSSFTGEHFVFTADASGTGTDITLQANPCYCRGTLIRTPTGEVRVQDLAIGDLVLTASGQARPVRWLGHRGLDCTRYSDPAVIWPIRIQAGAFAKDQPSRDLWVSPRHAILVDGVLIPAEKLVNGATIAQVPRDRVEYWHVELDSHDLLIAEGLAAESYLDNGNRTAFINGGEYLEAHPDFKPKHWTDTCLPLVEEGPVLQCAKAALLARAQERGYMGYELTDEADAHVVVDGERIDAVRLSDRRLAFTLPAAGSTIELRSRRYVPAQTLPSSGDQRGLGLCVSRLQIDGSDVPLADEAAFALGWHALEGNPDGSRWRWSRDRVPLPAGTRLIVIDIFGAGRYWAKPANTVVALFG
jgi:hypothetical protein